MIILLFVYCVNVLDEGEYICPVTTVFGLQQEEINWLVQNQDKMNLHDKLQDRNKSHDGIEITTSCWKVRQVLNTLAYKS